MQQLIRFIRFFIFGKRPKKNYYLEIGKNGEMIICSINPKHVSKLNIEDFVDVQVYIKLLGVVGENYLFRERQGDYESEVGQKTLILFKRLKNKMVDDGIEPQYHDSLKLYNDCLKSGIKIINRTCIVPQ